MHSRIVNLLYFEQNPQVVDLDKMKPMLLFLVPNHRLHLKLIFVSSLRVMKFSLFSLQSCLILYFAITTNFFSDYRKHSLITVFKCGRLCTRLLLASISGVQKTERTNWIIALNWTTLSQWWNLRLLLYRISRSEYKKCGIKRY